MAYFLSGATAPTVRVGTGIQLSNDPYMARVAAAKGNTKQLNALLTTLSSELVKCNTSLKTCTGPASTCAGLKVRSEQILKAINACKAALRAAPAPSARHTAIESATIKITGSGQVVPTSPATVIDTPTLQTTLPEIPNSPGNFVTKDVVVSSSTTFVVAAVAAAGILGYLALRKKGHA